MDDYHYGYRCWCLLGKRTRQGEAMRIGMLTDSVVDSQSSVTNGCLVVGLFLGSWRPNAGAVDGSGGAVRDRGAVVVG